MYMRKLSNRVENGFDEPTVKVRQGILRGIKVEGTYIFRGVKYAEATRFGMPKQLQETDDSVDAINYGYVCPTINVPYTHDMYRVPHFYYPENENCQFLNIWTPTIDSCAGLPVMVWLHGGGWSSGHGMEIYSCDGENLAHDNNVVVINLNHRLHYFGNLDLSRYGEKYKNSGCLSVADIIAALKWIQENVKAFGGNPDNITLFGQSGGGDKIVALLQTPTADGLFHKAILESGGVKKRLGIGTGLETIEEIREENRRMADIIVGRLNLQNGEIERIETIDRYRLQTVIAESIWIYRHEYGKPFVIKPVPGDYYLGSPYEIGFRKESGNIPLMVGCCFGEHNNNYDVNYGEGHKNDWDNEYSKVIIGEEFGKNGVECIRLFREAYPEKKLADLLFYGRTTRRECIEFCRLRAKQTNAPVYNWMFNLEAPFMNGTVAWHNAEESYVFRNACYSESQYEPGVSEELEDQISCSWTAFAKNGDPNNRLIPQWGSVTAETVPTMLFDRQTRLAIDHDKELLKMLEFPEKRSDKSEFNAAIQGIMPDELREDN